jgi:hypothetical protein
LINEEAFISIFTGGDDVGNECVDEAMSLLATTVFSIVGYDMKSIK